MENIYCHAENADLAVRLSEQVQFTFPGYVKILPTLMLAAKTNGERGALRAWALARQLDQLKRKTASGTVDNRLLNQWMRKLGVSERTRRRWIAAAKDLGLLITYRRTRSGSAGFRYVNPGRAALAIHSTINDRVPVMIATEDLVGENWRSFVWGGYLAETGGHPTSRCTHQRKTGVPRTTQKRLESQLPGLQVCFTFADTGLDLSYLPAIQEYLYPHAFGLTHPDGHQTVVHQVSNSYLVPETIAEKAQPGQTRKFRSKTKTAAHDGNANIMNGDAKNQISLNPDRSTLGAVLRNEQGDARIHRIYLTDCEHADAQLRKLAKNETLPSNVEVVVAMPIRQLGKKRPSGKCQMARIEALRPMSLQSVVHTQQKAEGGQ